MFGVMCSSFIYPLTKLDDTFIFLSLGETALGHVLLNQRSDFRSCLRFGEPLLRIGLRFCNGLRGHAVPPSCHQVL